MTRLYFFYCKECDKMTPIFECQMGWIDQTGKIGYRLTYEREPAGEYTGEWESVIIHDAMCIKCNLIYGIIVGDFSYKLKEQAMDDQSANLFVRVKDLKYEDGEIEEHKVYNMSNTCLKCQGELLTGSQLVERSLLKKDSRIVGLKLEDTKDRIMKCPTCRKSDFEFDHAIRYH